LAENAAAEPKVYACPTCGKEFDMPGKVTFHRIAAHKYRPAGSKGKKPASSSTSRAPAATGEAPRTTPPRPAVPDKEIEAEVDEGVANMRVVGGFLNGTFAPHLGLTIMGVEVDPRQLPAGTAAIEEPRGSGRYWLVRSRAVMIAPVLVDQCKRDLRFYFALRQFNRLFKLEGAVEVGVGLVAAGAVDAGIPPEMGFKLGRMTIQPIPAVIGDVLEFAAAQRQAEEQAGGGPAAPAAQQQQPAAASATANGQAPASEAEVVTGGVQDT
jgi:hypothetical protein